jgi:hypothetical protein
MSATLAGLAETWNFNLIKLMPQINQEAVLPGMQTLPLLALDVFAVWEELWEVSLSHGHD